AVALAGRLSMAILSRAWQMLLKGLEEAANAHNQAAAAEMVLIRLAYTADLPPPDEIIKALGGISAGVRVSNPSAPPERAPVRAPLNQMDAGSDDDADMEAGDEEALEVAAPAALPVVRTFAEVVELAGIRREAKLKIHLEEH